MIWNAFFWAYIIYLSFFLLSPFFLLELCYTILFYFYLSSIFLIVQNKFKYKNKIKYFSVYLNGMQVLITKKIKNDSKAESKNGRFTGKILILSLNKHIFLSLDQLRALPKKNPKYLHEKFYMKNIRLLTNSKN